MTPHVWICDQYTPQTLLIDLVEPSLRTQTLKLNITLSSSSSSDELVRISKTINPNANGFNRVDIELPESLTPGLYNLNVTASPSASASDYSFLGELAGIECRSSQNGIYIITDKPVYRESEKGIYSIDWYFFKFEIDILKFFLFKSENQNS